MMKHLATTAVIALMIAACAKRPEAIVPADIPMGAYTHLSCGELGSQLKGERAVLAALSDAQNSAATGDAVGVFLIGIPTSSAFGGNKEGSVAVSKGKVQAMELAMSSKRCPAV